MVPPIVLVYLKEPMGCSTVNGRRVYGEFYALGSFGPTNVPRKMFLENKSILEEIELTQKWLFEKTGKSFPTGFKTSSLHLLDFNLVIEIAELLGIEYIKSKKPSSIEKSSLRRSISKLIDTL